MDLNEIKDENYQNLSQINNSNISIKIDDDNYKGDIFKETQNSIYSRNDFCSHKHENSLFFCINSQKVFNENLNLVEKIFEDPVFLKIVDVRNQSEKIILIYEKPEFSLLSYLLKFKEDIYSRFLLLKQSIEIILKLISLEEKFSFFNYSIFFVEDKRNFEDFNDKNNSYNNDFLKLKIYYHGKI